MKQYLVMFSHKQNEPVSPAGALKVWASSHGNAAQIGLSQLHKSDPIRAAFRDGATVYAWAWLPATTPTHENGAPMCVHGMTLVRGAAV